MEPDMDDSPCYPCTCGYTFADRWEREDHWDTVSDEFTHGVPARGQEARQ